MTRYLSSFSIFPHQHSYFNQPSMMWNPTDGSGIEFRQRTKTSMISKTHCHHHRHLSDHRNNNCHHQHDRQNHDQNVRSMYRHIDSKSNLSISNTSNMNIMTIATITNMMSIENVRSMSRLQATFSPSLSPLLTGFYLIIIIVITIDYHYYCRYNLHVFNSTLNPNFIIFCQLHH